MNKTELLEEIYSEFINNGKFPEKDDFRNRHYQDLDSLDDLERSANLQDRDGLYWISLTELAKIKFWEHEKTIVNRLLPVLMKFRLDDINKNREIREILSFDMPWLKEKDVHRSLYYLKEACLIDICQKNPEGDVKAFRPREEVLRYKTIDERIENLKELRKRNAFPIIPTPIPSIQTRGAHMNISKNSWIEIQTEYDYSKLKFAKQINFLAPFKREIVIRDVVQAHSCLKQGFYKPAATLAGGAIEEILRLYLKHYGYAIKNKRFENLIEDCEKYSLLKPGLAHLTHSVRDFRNFIHLAKENSKQQSISRSIATGALSAVFTIAGNLRKPIQELKDKNGDKISEKIHLRIKKRVVVVSEGPWQKTRLRIVKN